MAPSSSTPDHTQEGHEGWTLVRVVANSEERSPQYKDCNISSSEKGTCTAGNGLSEFTTKLDHPQPDEVNGIYVHPVKVEHSDFGESTTTGPTSSTLDNNHLHSPSPIAHMKPCPLTHAILNDHNIPGSKRDIPAWINGDPNYWRPADDLSSMLPLKKGTTRHSSDGSFCVLMAPLQPCNVVQDLLGTGSSFDGTVSYSTQLEVE